MISRQNPPQVDLVQTFPSPARSASEICEPGDHHQSRLRATGSEEKSHVVHPENLSSHSLRLFLLHSETAQTQKRRDDNKNKMFVFGGGGGSIGGREENRPKTLFFLGKRHDKQFLKVQNLWSRFDWRNFVVVVQAP